MSWIGYIGKLTICCLLTYFCNLFLLERLIGDILSKDFIDTKIVKPLPWIVVNVLTLVLSDVLIYFFDGNNSITYWRGKYNELDKSYGDLKKIYKKLLFKSSELKAFYREDFLVYLREVTDNSKNHLDDLDIEILKEKFEPNAITSSEMNRLVETSEVIRNNNSINGSFKKPPK